MSRRKNTAAGAMLEQWRPPTNAGEPVGCLATTFTFDSTLFEEQCLGRFLGLDSVPERDGLVSILERENALGGIFAGVLVDHQKAGVAHSMRWDVLSVRIPTGIQHAKLSLLAWSRHVRLLVSSANLTEPGYRTNQEISTAVELTPEAVDQDLWTDASTFLRQLLEFSPDSAARTRAASFLDRVERIFGDWTPIPTRRQVHQRLVCTLPAVGARRPARSALDEALALCRGLGGRAPSDVAIASPFFDQSAHERSAMQALGRAMGRGVDRHVELALPAEHLAEATRPRLLAPEFLRRQAKDHAADVTVTALPATDEDKNARPWHAKMIRFADADYVALLVGSSNFTTAGLGTATRFNAEANLLTVVRSADRRGDAGALHAIWPRTTPVPRPESAEWVGSGDEEGVAGAENDRIPAGFVTATFRAGEPAQLELQLEPDGLPERWSVWSTAVPAVQLLSSDHPVVRGAEARRLVPWGAMSPPDTVQVRWDEDRSGILAVNVEDPGSLRPPADLEGLDSEAMLRLLAATNPAAELRLMLRERGPAQEEDDLLDIAVPPELDPLRRHDLQATFLYRVRARARLMEGIRANLQRPAWSAKALEWRLRGMIGPREVGRRLMREAESAQDPTEALFSAADLVILLREVSFPEQPGGLPLPEVRRLFRAFRRELAADLDAAIQPLRPRIAMDVLAFWDGIVQEDK